MAQLTLDDVSISYGGVSVVQNLSLGVASGEFLVIVGASGCGKTSLLNVAAGFLAPSGGRVQLDGRAISGPGPERAVVFQHDALFPWLTVAQNVAFALRLKRLPKAERRQRAEASLSAVGLSGYGDRPIWQLSGGQRQRVGLARALTADPAFLLMDEPLGALDALTREQMQSLLLSVWARSGKGILLITHGVDEALLLATQLIVMAPHPGRIVETATLDFGKRVAAGEPVRSVKSDPAFLRERDHLLDLLLADVTP